MSRLPSALILSLLLTGSVARADTFGGWQYAAPPGYTVDVGQDHVQLTKLTGKTFCSLALFEARALAGPVAKERAFEWYNVVTHTFKARVTRRATTQTKQAVDIAATTAALSDSDGNKYAAVHYVVMPPEMIGSVLLISPTTASLRGCEPVARQFVSSLAIDWSSPRFHDPEARVETPVGQWAVVGPVHRGYTFAADRTYRFHSEATHGDTVRVVDERGKYTVLGNQLTLTPLATTTALVDHGVARPVASRTLEKATYTWSKLYFPDSNEWQLVLKPRKATKRDGKLPDGDAGRHDYRYSDHTDPGWKFAPTPGA